VCNLNSVNDVRLQLFRKVYAPEKESDLLKKIKASDPCCLPPCQRVLQQKLLRTNFVAYVWKHTRESRPVAFGPDGDGVRWQTTEDSVVSGLQARDAPTNFVTKESNSEDETDDETDAEETSSQQEEEEEGEEEEMDDN